MQIQKIDLPLLSLIIPRGAHRPVTSGIFYAHLIKGGGALRVSKTHRPVDGFSSANATAIFCGHNLKYIVMLNESTTSDSSSQPCPAKSIINNLLLTDNLDDLRHRLSRDFMQLLTSEPDELERNRMYSDFNTLDMILETIEKERK